MSQSSKGRADTPPQPKAAKGVKIAASVAAALLALLALAVWGVVRALS